LRGHPRKDEIFAVLALSTSSRYQHLIYAEPTLLSSTTSNTQVTTTRENLVSPRTIQLEQTLPSLTSIKQCETWQSKLDEWSGVVRDTKKELLQKQQDAYEQLLAESLCLVCQLEKKCMALVPCGHVCMCRGCCNTVTYHTSVGNTCPLCNATIESTMRVFL
jgi:hypothetical protein